jgi:hypothetical protein
MGLLDFTLILDYIIALGIVALPVELGILLLIDKFRRRVTSMMDSPEKRAELIREVALQIWEPLQQPDQRKALIDEVTGRLWEPLKTPEQRQKLIGELGHGVIRAFREQMGSVKGVAARQENAAGIEQLLEGGGGMGALSLIKGKIELPVVGKVTPMEALQLFNTIKGLISGKGLAQLTGGSQTSGARGLP